MLVTRMLRDSRIAARDAAAMPFPNEETTPPVTKTYLAIYLSRGEIRKFTGFCFLSLPEALRRLPREGGDPVSFKKNGSPLSRERDPAPNPRTPTGSRPSCRRDAPRGCFRASPTESPGGAAARGGSGRCARQAPPR